MKVELISYTGDGNPDDLYAARLLVYTKNTRLEQGSETRTKVAAMSRDDLLKELDYISKTIRSSWEFVSYTFEITDVTRAFTHQLVRTRTGSYAQQSQRSVEMSGFKSVKPVLVGIHATANLAWDSLMDAIAQTYRVLQVSNIPTQDCRGVLPTNVCTNIIAKFNLRTLADLIGKRENLRAQGEYGSVALRFYEEVVRVHPWAEVFLHPERTRTPALDAIFKRLVGDATPASLPEVNAALKEIDALKGTWG